MLQNMSVSNKCFSFYLSKNPENIYHCFHKNIKKHNNFQHW